MSFLDFSRIESSREDLNRNEKIHMSPRDVTLKTDPNYITSNTDITQTNPFTKAFKWVGVIATVAVVVVIVVCLVVFVEHGPGDDENKKYSTHSSFQKGTSFSTKAHTTPRMSHTTRTSSVATRVESASASTSSDSSDPLYETTTPVTSYTTLSSGPESIDGQGNGRWSSWGSWTMCAVTCGSSVHSRYRTCIKNTVNDTNCVGDFKEQKDCTTTTCPVYGAWTTWQSWIDCDVTCGGGTRTRSRSCNKNVSKDRDCVGSSTQRQTCNNWACPDCSRNCSTGNLSRECDACECPYFNVQGLVRNAHGAALQNVRISHESAPYRQLATSNRNGTFEVNSVCAQNKIIFTKTGYQDTTFKIMSPTVTVTMQLIQYPLITTQPKSYRRLEGESVEFCCNAAGNPAITSYEWLKNGNLVNESLYPDGTRLFLSNLKFVDSGTIICRANSPVGAAFSDSVFLTVRENPDDFCSEAYEPYEIDLPSDCVQSDTNSVKYDIGKCSPKSCRNNVSNPEQSCSVDRMHCCIPSGKERRIIQCSGYSFPLYVTTSCACGACGSSDITINGQAIGVTSGLPLILGNIEIDGNTVGSTGIIGDFTFTVPRGTTRIAVKFKDRYFNQFLDTLKIIRLNEEISGSFNVHIAMIEKTAPINIDPTVSNTLQLGDQNGKESIASVTIPPNSTFFPNGTQFDGAVKASLIFFDPRNSTSIQNAPGEFVSIDLEGQVQNLQSFGVFSLFLQDQAGSSLHLAGETEIKLDQTFFETTSLGNLSDAKMWGLNPDTGIWEEQAALRILASRRKKRHMTFLVGSVEISAYYWWNIDVDYTYKNCYFKTQAFEGYTEITNYNARIIYNNSENRIGAPTYREQYMGSNNAFEAICRDEQPLKGYIEVERNGQIFLVNNINSGLSSEAELFIDYAVVPGNRSVSVNVRMSDSGPFYKTPGANFQNMFRFALESDAYAFKILNPSIEEIFIDARNAKLIKGNEVWYPPLNSFVKENIEYQTCFIKIGASNANRNLAFRVVSRNEKSTLLGVHEKKLTNGATCIEYRCSGRNPKFDLFFLNNTDFIRDPATYTLITVTPIGQVCYVSNESSEIRTHEKSSEGVKLSRSNIGNKYFEAYIPDKQYEGIFFDTNRRREDAMNYSNRKCNSGISESHSEIMRPNIGLAVIFRCF